MFKKNCHLLITGGTGSFGKAMLEKILFNKNISKISILSRDEKKQDDLRKQFNNKKLNFILCDIRDRENVFSSINDVDYIFHAAALKQVPSCEFNPMEAVKTNILGALNVIDASIRNNVKKIVLLSTDKAAYPINTLGCSKMLMEKIMFAKTTEKSKNSKTIICAIRYGNVLFSRGSVVPLFLKQLSDNKPLTITNPSMTRFLISLSEAIDLVLYALSHGKNGDLFIRKSKAATILNIAKACSLMFNKELNINYIGIREGEKMDETLATREEVAKSEDRNTYLRIPHEQSKNFNKYFTEGTITREIFPFTSKNTKQLSIEEIIGIFKAIPEIQQILNVNKHMINLPLNVSESFTNSLLIN